VLFPTLALAQSGSPFDTGFTALQNLFTGTVAKVASLIAIVIGGYEFAHGEPGAKKASACINTWSRRITRTFRSQITTNHPHTQRPARYSGECPGSIEETLLCSRKAECRWDAAV